MYHGQQLVEGQVDFRELANLLEWLKGDPVTCRATDEGGVPYDRITKYKVEPFKGIGKECKKMATARGKSDERKLLELAEKFIQFLAKSTLGRNGTAQQYWSVDSRRHVMVGSHMTDSVSPSERYPRVRIGMRTLHVTRQYQGRELLHEAPGPPYRVQLDLHRMACFLAHGPHPQGRPLALHTCHRKNCLNPGHLYWGAASHNQLDAYLRESRDPSRAGDKSLW
jgi:hypothetical protein